MAVRAVLFDLDGTLLPMDQDVFIKSYFKGLVSALAPRGYAPEAVFDAVWQGVRAMVKNDGTRLNEEAFWESFAGSLGERVLEEKPILEEFYRTAFNEVRHVCGHDPRAAAIVRSLKEKGVRVILATNPLFPAIATESRMRWAGLQPEDFELYTTYENIGCCKPNPAYYREILRRIDCKAEECVMVGNDVGEDMIARDLGMGVFLLTDCLINKDGRDISCYPNGGFDELADFLNNI